MVNNPLAVNRTGRGKAAIKGQAGYDNPRENIDPNIKTSAITSKEINIQKSNSTTMITNLNADMIDGLHANQIAGTTDHAGLSHLAYADAGHTGFQPAGSYEAANANIQTHVTGTGSPHTAAGVGADATGTASGLMTTHNSSYTHSDIALNTAARHTRQHAINSVSDHTGYGDIVTHNASEFQAAGTYVTSVSGTSPIASSGTTTPAISIANAAADGATKGAATFNSTNFSASLGVINTIQDIATTSAPSFASGSKISEAKAGTETTFKIINSSATGSYATLYLQPTSTAGDSFQLYRGSGTNGTVNLYNSGTGAINIAPNGATRAAFGTTSTAFSSASSNNYTCSLTSNGANTGVYLILNGQNSSWGYIQFQNNSSSIWTIGNSGGTANYLNFYQGSNLAMSITTTPDVIIANDLRVDGGDIGLSADTDLIHIAANAVTINGSLTVAGTTELKGTARLLEFGGAVGNLAANTAYYWASSGTGGLMSTTQGFVMHRAGSITGISMSYDCLVVGTGVTTLSIEVRVNNTVVWSNAITKTNTNDLTQYFTQARGTDTFAAGDQLQVTLTAVGGDGVGNYVTVLNTIGILEIYMDT